MRPRLSRIRRVCQRPHRVFSTEFVSKQEKLTCLHTTNSGLTTKTQEDGWTEVGTAAGAKDIAGQRAVLPGMAGFRKERVIVPWAGRRHWVSDRGLRFRRSGLTIDERPII